MSILKQMTADRVVALTLLVSALGYFVDIFDLLLFSIVRVQSLKDLGVAEADLLSAGIRLLNVQMAGLFVGGFIWGMAGDKLGRISVLFASILLYSVSNIANGFVTTVDQYAALRFITGLGLAGELGISVTLASELLPRGIRGLGTTFIVVIGILGATFAYFVSTLTDWRTAYIIGGVMGLGLLLLRVGLREPALFLKAKKKDVPHGNPLLFFKKPALLGRYISIIIIGAPLWAIVGIFITFTPEFAKAFGMTDIPTAGKAVMWCYTGLSLGDLFSGTLSQYLKSRKRAIATFLLSLIMATALFVTVRTQSTAVYYALCFMLGVSIGYWTLFVQVGAEQFGTNLRATAATTVPNVVRGLTIPMTCAFQALIPKLGVINSGLAVLGTAVTLAFACLWKMRETFHADLDYTD